MTKKIQLALQGGGARLAALLAAGEAIQELEREKAIEIGRIAGTSAGSILALLLATKANIPQLRKNLQGQRGREISRVFPEIGWLRAATNLSFKKPILSISRFRRFLFDALRDIDIDTNQSVEEFAKKTCPIFFVAANIMTGREPRYDCTRSVLDAVVDSCALPYVYRVTGEYMIIDGGIFDNLPAARLIGDEDQFGKVVAISFSEDDYREPPRSVRQFSSMLIGAMIDSKTQQSKELVGSENLCPIETDIKTFDFNLFQSSLDQHYRSVKAETRGWFKDWLTVQDTRSVASVQVGGQSQGEELRSLRNKIADLYDLLKPVAKPAGKLLRMEVTAHSLLAENDEKSKAPDEVRLTYHIQPAEGAPIKALKLYLMTTDALIREHARWEVFTSAKEPVPFAVLPLIDQRREQSESVLIFEPALSRVRDSDVYYVIVSTQTISGFMSPLRKDGTDFLGFAASEFANAARVEIVLFIPTGFAIEQTTYDELKDYEVIAGAPFTPLGLPTPPGFAAVGWAGGPIAHGQGVAVRYATALGNPPTS